MPPGRSSAPDPDFERRLLTLVDEALQRPPADRAAFLAAACAGDAGLLAAAERLVESCRQAEGEEGFLSGTAADFAEPLIREVTTGGGLPAEPLPSALTAALALRYRVRREIGRGGHATVLLARDERHERDLAIKVIRPEACEGGQRQRFLQEIGIVARLHHPYIVPLVESGEAGGVPYYVMPYVAGETLRQRLDREGPLPLDEALRIAGDVAEAIDYAHRNGVVHRDIKPENVLLSGGHALVADFGVALALDAMGGARLTRQGIAVGTPAYMSPEQAGGSGRIDSRSDIYSLGCVVYEMLAGEVPFPGDTPRTILAKQQQAPIPDLTILRPTLAHGVTAVMERALAKLPAERYATAGEFLRALAAASADTRLAGGGRSWLGSAVAAGLFAVLLVVAWILAPQQPPPTNVVVAPEPDRRRIAVLYFDNLSADPGFDVVASGLTEDLIDALAQVKGLSVISPNGVRPLRGRNPPIDSVARALVVGTVVGGSVSASPGAVRATVRLVDPHSGEQLQSQSFEVQRGATLALRDAIVLQVATFLRSRLGEEIRLHQERVEAGNAEAWAASSRATALLRDGADAGQSGRGADATDLTRRADSLYTVAARLAPGWGRPLVGRGWATLALAATAAPDSAARARAERLQHRALSLADQAVQRSSGSAEALALRGYVRRWISVVGHPASPGAMLRLAEADLRAAIDLRPDDARSWATLGALLQDDGRFREAAVALRRAYDTDAYLTEVRDVVMQLFWLSLNLGEMSEAERWCRVGQERYAGDPRFTACRVIYLGWAGRSAGAVDSAWRALGRIEAGDSTGMFASQWGFLRVMVAMTAARAGLPDSARSILREVHAGLAADSGRTAFPDGEAYVHLLLGERAVAIGILVDEVRRDPISRPAVLASPWFAPLVADSSLPRALRSLPAGGR